MRDSVLVFTVTDDRLLLATEIGGYSFPHGVHFYAPSRLLAVTNYGINSIVIRKM